MLWFRPWFWILLAIPDQESDSVKGGFVTPLAGNTTPCLMHDVLVQPPPRRNCRQVKVAFAKVATRR